MPDHEAEIGRLKDELVECVHRYKYDGTYQLAQLLRDLEHFGGIIEHAESRAKPYKRRDGTRVADERQGERRGGKAIRLTSPYFAVEDSFVPRDTLSEWLANSGLDRRSGRDRRQG